MGIRIRTRNKIRTMTNYPTGSTTVERERERDRRNRICLSGVHSKLVTGINALREICLLSGQPLEWLRQWFQVRRIQRKPFSLGQGFQCSAYICYHILRALAASLVCNSQSFEPGKILSILALSKNFFPSTTQHEK